MNSWLGYGSTRFARAPEVRFGLVGSLRGHVALVTGASDYPFARFVADAVISAVAAAKGL